MLMLMRSILLALVFGALSLSLNAHQNRPKLIRVHMVSYVMSQESYTELMLRERSQKSDYAEVRSLVNQELASVADVKIISGRSGEKFEIESVREFIYPTEYSVSEVPSQPSLAQQSALLKARSLTKFSRPAPPVAFETRNLGMTLEVQPTLGESGNIIDLSLHSEFVDSVGFSKWLEIQDQWGKDGLKMPIFLSQKINTALTLQNGEFYLFNTYTPKDIKGELDPSRKLLVFAMAEIIYVENPDH